MKVTLKKYEMLAAAYVGIRRHLISLDSKDFNKVQNTKYGWHTDIEAACGEMAAAKKLGLYWDGSVNTFKEPDLLPDLQVRTSDEMWHHLIVRDGDKDIERYIKVVGRSPHFELVGWIYGYEGMKEEYVKDPGESYPAFFVPLDRLRPMKTFRIQDVYK